MHQILQRNRLVLILAAVSVLVILLIWLVSNLMRINDATTHSRLKLTMPNVDDEHFVRLSEANTSEAYIAGVQQRNLEQAHQSEQRGTSHVDRLVNGIQVPQSDDAKALADLQQAVQGLRDSQAALQNQLQRIDSSKNLRPRVSNKDSLAFYTALTGVEHLSEHFLSSERDAIARVIDRVSGTGNAMSVGLLVNARDHQVNVDKRISRTSKPTITEPDRSAALRNENAIEIIPAGEVVLHAKLNLGLNSDLGGIASATLVGGRLHGTVLTASGYSAKRRHLAINFDRFCTPQGACGNIRAIAVDLDEGVAAIKGDYRGHYGVRLGGRIAASILEGYGRAISAGIGSDSISVNGRIISTQTDDVSSKQALKASALEAGSTVGQFFREFANRPPLVSKNVNELIGIYVVSPGFWRVDNASTQVSVELQAEAKESVHDY